jgi:hypothetical protein
MHYTTFNSKLTQVNSLTGQYINIDISDGVSITLNKNDWNKVIKLCYHHKDLMKNNPFASGIYMDTLNDFINLLENNI